MSEYYGVQRSKEYLAHYGVLGMKWGIRKAAKNGTDYHYQSHATKKYNKLAAKLAAKGKTEKAAKMSQRAKRSAEIDRGEEEYARNISTGKAIAGTLLAGGSSMKGYMQNRAMEKQGGKGASGKKVTSAILAGLSGSGGSRLRKAAYIRQDEQRKGPGEAIRKFDTKVRNAVSNAIDPATKAYNEHAGKKVTTISGASKQSASKVSKTASKSSSSLSKYSKDVNKGTTAAGLIGGGLGAGLKTASNLNKMKKNNPKEYAKFKKAYSNASMKERMRFAYGR